MNYLVCTATLVALGMSVYVNSAAAEKLQNKDAVATSESTILKIRDAKQICMSKENDQFSNAKRNSIVLQTASGKSYLIKTSHCGPMAKVRHITFDEKEDSGCLYRGSKMYVSENVHGIVSARCYISKMTPIITREQPQPQPNSSITFSWH